LARELPLPAPDGLLVGVILGAQGLKGEVKVKAFTAAPHSIGCYGPLFTEDGRSFAVKAVRPIKGDNAALLLTGINDRGSAESLKGVRLYIPRAALPQPKKNEFYHADLLGLGVEDESGKKLGVVCGVHNFGAGDVIEIAIGETDTSFIPFTKAEVPVVDLAGGRLVVSNIAAWLEQPQ
jgi:16S rRNA processing protein RimM